MKMQDFGFGWIDLLIVGVLVAGVVRGRKRGISEELLDVVKWVIIVVAAAFTYQPLGSFLSGTTPFSHLSSYLSMYVLVAVAFVVLFSFLRRAFGGKLIGGDIFGSAEYYLGMGAGAVRYACIMLVMMALLNARYYSPGEVRAHIKFQEDNFGSVFFPSVCAMQREVFDESWTGRLTKSYLGILLIKPTAPEEKGLAGASVIKARERNVYDVLEK
jgi:uncharacterized membrane protein required for colicin V production